MQEYKYMFGNPLNWYVFWIFPICIIMYVHTYMHVLIKCQQAVGTVWPGISKLGKVSISFRVFIIIIYCLGHQ